MPPKKQNKASAGPTPPPSTHATINGTKGSAKATVPISGKHPSKANAKGGAVKPATSKKCKSGTKVDASKTGGVPNKPTQKEKKNVAKSAPAFCKERLDVAVATPTVGLTSMAQPYSTVPGAEATTPCSTVETEGKSTEYPTLNEDVTEVVGASVPGGPSHTSAVSLPGNTNVIPVQDLVVSAAFALERQAVAAVSMDQKLNLLADAAKTDANAEGDDGFMIVSGEIDEVDSTDEEDEEWRVSVKDEDETDLEFSDCGDESDYVEAKGAEAFH